jgi:Family of unknown function (DUF5764)
MSENTPLLLDARKEYMAKLADCLFPFLCTWLTTTFREAERKVGKNKSLVEFQRSLQAVPHWNSIQISGYARAIEAKYSFITQLIAAVFVTQVKILSSIRINPNRPNVKLRLPNNEKFVHQVYVETARAFFDAPEIIYERESTKKALILKAIDNAVRCLLPLDDVLKAYLSSTHDEEQGTIPGILSPVHSSDEEDQDEVQDRSAAFDEPEKVQEAPVQDDKSSVDPFSSDDESDAAAADEVKNVSFEAPPAVYIPPPAVPEPVSMEPENNDADFR